MNKPTCPRCHADLEWEHDVQYRCPAGHVERLDGITQMLLESVFEDSPCLYTMFWRAFTLNVQDDRTPEWNADLYAHELGTTEHKVHLLVYADLARAEWAEQHV
jgi:hypothetical protein